jgi:subtilisin family serine protease
VKLRLALFAFSVAFLAACSSPAVVVEQDARVAFAGSTDQYVVITVHNRQALMPRAGSTSRDYDSPASYNLSPSARSELRALASAHRLREVDGWPIVPLGVHCAVFQLPSDVAPAEALRQLSRDRRVESVQPLNAFSTMSANNDPYRGLQRNLDAMQIEQAHAWSRGEKTRVAVIDTGIDAAHPDLKGRIAVQRNLVDAGATPPERHGTAVAGVIAALDDNREGIVGIAPAASLLGLKACWPQTADGATSVCNTFTLAKALAAAVEEHSDIVNLSLAGPADPLLQRLVEYGAKRGVIYVGALPSAAPGFPCNIASVICVGSAGHPDPTPQLFAPGAEVLTLLPQGRYDFLSGSSLAAASVSASIALLRSKDPDITAGDARRLLSSTATQSAGVDGAPSINACAALAKMLGLGGCRAEQMRVSPLARERQ